MSGWFGTLAGVVTRAWAAGRGFLRGFTGIDGAGRGALGAPTSPAAARDALAGRAARRGRCC